MFSAVGGYGHVIPLIALAQAVRDAGHEVAFATAGKFHRVLGEAGLEPIEAGGTVEEAVAVVARSVPGPGGNASPQAFGYVLARRFAADLASLLPRWKPDGVVYEVLNPGAGIAAHLAGVPAVCHGTGRISGGANWQAMSQVWLDTAADLGVKGVPRDALAFFGDLFLDVCPPSLQLPGLPAGRQLLRPQLWDQGGDLPAWITQRDWGRPLVFLSLGTAFTTAEVLATVMAGVARLDVDVLVTGGRRADLAELGPVPDNVAVADWVPQGEALREASLVVTHGGSGSVWESLSLGLPMLVLPQGADQFSNAEMVVRAGAGRSLVPARVTAEAVHEQAEALLADATVRAEAARLRAEIASMPAPDEVVDLLVRHFTAG